VRHDRNSQFGGSDAWFAGYGYRITQNWRVNVSHGTSFVAPSFNQLYFPDTGYGGGNPNLKPEKGKNTEIGIAWNQGDHTIKLVGYDNRVTNLISGWPPENIGRAYIRGGTLSYDGQFGGLVLHASLDMLNPRDEDTSRLLRRRAKNQAALGADYRTGAWTFGGTVLRVSRRYDDAGNTQVLGGYTTVDLYAEYRVAKDWSVLGRVVNAGDVKYETAWGYNQPRRAFYVTLRWQPR
jgi:vitamin B12 transporter